VFVLLSVISVEWSADGFAVTWFVVVALAVFCTCVPSGTIVVVATFMEGFVGEETKDGCREFTEPTTTIVMGSVWTGAPGVNKM